MSKRDLKEKEKIQSIKLKRGESLYIELKPSRDRAILPNRINKYTNVVGRSLAVHWPLHGR